jgi:predicted RNase H-like HicB family nuclease
MEVTVVVHQERGSHWAEIRELPGCLASGRTLEELREAVAEAIGLYLWDLPAELRGTLNETGASTVEVLPATADGDRTRGA